MKNDQIHSKLHKFEELKNRRFSLYLESFDNLNIISMISSILPFKSNSPDVNSMNEQKGILCVVLHNRDLELVVSVRTNSLLAPISDDLWYDVIALCWC